MPTTNKSAYSTHRVVLSYVSTPGLKPEEYRVIADARKHLDVIKSNLSSRGKDAFNGLSKEDKQNLLAYVTFSKENGFTHSDKGHTPIEDSARSLVREKDLYGDEESLDKALVTIINKTKEKPFKELLVQDERGMVKAAE